MNVHQTRSWTSTRYGAGLPPDRDRHPPENGTGYAPYTEMDILQAQTWTSTRQQFKNQPNIQTYS
jgi:hypothetical protein